MAESLSRLGSDEVIAAPLPAAAANVSDTLIDGVSSRGGG